MAWSQVNVSPARAFKPGVLIEDVLNNSYTHSETGEKFDSRDVFVKHNPMKISRDVPPRYYPRHGCECCK